MRNNLPVTDQEFVFPAGRNIVSVTDLKGRITYCNDVFVQASGYSREELLGQPHNLLRHPDMPEEAFRDLWDTIQAGLPWIGVVKNRRKNGDYYWVVANVTPMLDDRGICGYLSVRSAPQRAQIEQAAALYQVLKHQEQGGSKRIALRRGAVVKNSWSGWIALQMKGGVAALGGMTSLTMHLGGAAAVAAAMLWLPPAAAWPAAGLFALLASWTSHRIAKGPIRDILSDTIRLAAGDLSRNPRHDASGELGLLQLAFQQVAVNMRSVISDLRCEIECVRSAAQEISAGNRNLSARTESQASSLEQTAASMEQITGTVHQSAQSAQQGAQSGTDATSAANRSHDAVLNVSHAMDAIQGASQHIRNIIQVIEGVAFQTNILALNAAVEAARAGEQGRGFAVVATEVRTLAQRTAEAAGQIRQLIDDATTKVAAGHQQTVDARERMQFALQAVTRVNAMLEEISQTANQQKAGISQVNDAVSQLDSITRQNATMVGDLAASAGALDQQVQGILRCMSLFRLSSLDPSVARADAVGLRQDGKAARSAQAQATREVAPAAQ